MLTEEPTIVIPLPQVLKHNARTEFISERAKMMQSWSDYLDKTTGNYDGEVEVGDKIRVTLHDEIRRPIEVF